MEAIAKSGILVACLECGGEDAWKAIDIAEVMKKAGSPVPPEMQQANLIQSSPVETVE